MAQAQINTQIATLELNGDLIITAEMGFTRLILSSYGDATLTGNLGIAGNDPSPINLITGVNFTIGNGSQLINNIKLTGKIRIIAFN